MKRIFLVLFLLFACSATPRLTLTGEQEVTLTVEIADEPAEWQRGLQHRFSLPPRHGMLFVFPDSDVRSFWMKDTFIPLDMLFIDEHGTIVSLFTHVQPEEGPDYASYSSQVPVKYVLEVPAGFVAEYGINVGDRQHLYT